jgi:hypothetical protein
MRRSLLHSTIFAVLILSAIPASTHANKSSERSILTPILGNYPDTSLSLSANTAVTPDATPMNTTSINVSTSTDFKGTLEGNPITGVVRVTDAHPVGIFTVTVQAFDGDGRSADVQAG